MMRPAVFLSFSSFRGPRRAFSLVELLVVIGILALLAAILLPVFFTARAKAHTTQCAANLRQIGVALQSYVQDYDGTYPPLIETPVVNTQPEDADAPWWQDLLRHYIKGHFPRCPNRVISASWQPIGENDTRICGYGYNTNLAGAVVSPNQVTSYGAAENIVSTPALLVAVFDSRIGLAARLEPDMGDVSPTLNVAPGATRHQNGANYLFADGHVKWFLPSGLTTGEKGDGLHPGFGL